MKIYLKKIRLYFISGLLIIIPLGVTIFIIRWILDLAFSTINSLPTLINPLYYIHKYLRIPIELYGFISILLILLIIFLIGLITTNYFGKKILFLWNKLLSKVPLIKTLYNGTLQLLESIFHTSEHSSFREVVLVQFPTENSWSLAFITNKQNEFHSLLSDSQDLISVFVPTTPNPTSGFLLLVDRSNIKLTDYTVDQAFKMIISGGVLKKTSSLKK